MRRALIATGWWAVLLPGFFSLQLEATQAFDDQFYFYSFIPVIMIYTAGLFQALYRRSRSAWFLAVAWLPIIAAACERLLRGIGLYSAPSSADQLLYVGLGAEVVIIAIGVADRFLSVRRERDRALTAAEMLEELSERDPLTGLMNRRAIKHRFTDLRRAGYDTFALIDLDKFKDVNDQLGHNTGDEVLRAVGEALKADSDMLAIRMGGEEFLLLLRGDDSIARAEQRRQAISLRIARAVEGMDRMVTASMGVIEAPFAALPNAEFEDIYQRADELLYEAKEAGRNRTASETLRAFRRPQNDRRTRAA
jgi:diguanylate cyclase (GGDEF)-like protein